MSDNTQANQPAAPKVEFVSTRNGVSINFAMSKIKGATEADPISEFPCPIKEEIIKNPQSIIDFLGIKEAAKIVYGKIRQWSQELYEEEAGIYDKVKGLDGVEEEVLSDVRPMTPELAKTLSEAIAALDARSESKKELLDSKEELFVEFSLLLESSDNDPVLAARLKEVTAELRAVNTALAKKKRTRGPNKTKEAAKPTALVGATV